MDNTIEEQGRWRKRHQCGEVTFIVTGHHPDRTLDTHRKLTRASIVLLALGALGALVTASSPMGVNPFCALAGCAAPLWWLARLLAFAVYSKRNWRHVPPFPHRGLLVWAVEPLLLLSTFWLCHQEIPLRLRFAASRPALERYVRVAGTRQGALRTPAQVGLYTVREAQSLEPHTWLLTTDTWSVICTDRFGFAYRPDGPPPADEGYTHLEGDWYVWVELG